MDNMGKLTLDEKIIADWKANKNGVQQEFTDLAQFSAFVKAKADGRVRIFGEK